MERPFSAGESINGYCFIEYNQGGDFHTLVKFPQYIQFGQVDNITDLLNEFWDERKENASTRVFMTGGSCYIQYEFNGKLRDVIALKTPEEAAEVAKGLNQWHTVVPYKDVQEVTYTQAQMDEVLGALRELYDAVKRNGMGVASAPKKRAAQLLTIFKK